MTARACRPIGSKTPGSRWRHVSPPAAGGSAPLCVVVWSGPRARGGRGVYHWRRGNWRGAVAKLGHGLTKLEPYRPVCMTIDVERLVVETAALRDLLERRGASDLPAFPPPRLPRVHRTTETA